MTNNQKQFIKENFFKNDKYAGWSNIANELLDDGECIIAGDNKLWHGAIGNFIKISDAKGTVGCSLLTFDKESFLRSDWFQEYLIDKLKELARKREEFNKNFDELSMMMW